MKKEQKLEQFRNANNAEEKGLAFLCLLFIPLINNYLSTCAYWENRLFLTLHGWMLR